MTARVTPADLMSLALLLLRVQRRGLARRVSASFEEQRDLPGELTFDRYTPKRPRRGLLVLVHGVTLNGKDDPRLVHLCRCLASVGVVAIAPMLPGLARLEWQASDVEQLACFVSAVAREHGPVGLVGFSVGASYALVVAGSPRCRDDVHSLVSFGACHSLASVYRDWVATAPRAGSALETRPDLDDWLYLRLVTAWRQRDGLGLSPRAETRLQSLLRDYCLAHSPPEALAFFRGPLAARDMVALDARRQDQTVLAALSPERQLDGVRCPVALLHDATDALVPPHHARRISDELARHPHRLVVTRLLRHVGARPFLRPAELLRVLAVLLWLVRPPVPPPEQEATSC